MSATRQLPELPDLTAREAALQGLSLGQLLAILAAHTRLIIGVALGLMVFTALFSRFVLPRIYVASAQLLVDYDVTSPDSNREFSPMLAENYMKTQTAFINSTPVLGPVVDDLRWSQSKDKTKDYSGPASGLREHLIWKVLSPNLTITNPQNTRFVYISYQSKSPQEAAGVANAVAERFVAEHSQRLRAPAKKRAEEYLSSLAQLKTRLDAAQNAVADFRKRTGLIELDARTLAEQERLQEMDRALLVAEGERTAASIRAQQAERLSANGSLGDVEYAASPAVVRIKDELMTAEKRFDEYSKVLGPRHPEYLAAEAEVKALRGKLDQETRGYAGGLGGNTRTAVAQSSALVNSLESRIQGERQRILKTRELQDEAAKLLTELDAADKIYKSALDDYDRIVRGASSQFSNVSIVAPASPPLKHAKPQSTANAIVGLIAGLLLGFLAALLKEYQDRRVRCREDLERQLQHPVIAVLSFQTGKRA